MSAAAWFVDCLFFSLIVYPGMVALHEMLVVFDVMIVVIVVAVVVNENSEVVMQQVQQVKQRDLVA